MGVALAAARLGAGYGSKVVVLAGPGNNGGDGYVAARHLRRRGAEVLVHALGYPKGDDAPARIAASTAVDSGVRVVPLDAPEDCDLVIDALFGAGFRGEIPAEAAAWTGAGHRVLAVDLPSGLDGETGEAAGPVFRAQRTVTFHAIKVGHLIGEGPDLCGDLEVVDIGLTGGAPVFVVCDDDDAPALPRDRRAHKWSAGSVAVVGGSPGITGAPMLAARSALSSGAGAVRLLCAGGLEPTYAAMSPGVMTAGIGTGTRLGEEDADAILEGAARFDVLVVGPGLGEAGGLVAALVERWDGPLLIDADAIAACTVEGLEARSGSTLLTPHAGEFERLTGEVAGWRAAATLATTTGAVVILKGAPTFVAGEQIWAVTAGGRELATIGTGDVLAGVAAAFVARGLDPEIAARSSAHRHGRAGGSLAARTTVTAEGLVSEIGRFAW